METDEREDLVWSCIKPADNSLTPCNSDGYNEGEVYGAVQKAVTKMLEKYGPDAEKWRELQDTINNLNADKDEEDCWRDEEVTLIGEDALKIAGIL